MAKVLSQKTRAFVAHRAGNICEYCRTPAAFSSSKFSIEHIIPQVKSGSDDVENLAFACLGCNNIKYTKIEGLDLESRSLAPLFNPRIHIWEEHFCWDVDLLQIIGLTPTGRATVSVLKLNREELCNLRAVLFLIGEHPPKV